MNGNEVALLRTFSALTKDRQRVHGAVECGYSTFTDGGKTYLQLDTYGSPARQIRGKTSQTVQLDEVAARQLKRLIEATFPGA